MNVILLIKSLSFLAAVILLIYLCFLLVKKRMHAKAGAHHHRIKVIEHRRLDQKLTVSLIVVDGEKLVLAVGPSAIALKKLSLSVDLRPILHPTANQENEVH